MRKSQKSYWIINQVSKHPDQIDISRSLLKDIHKENQMNLVSEMEEVEAGWLVAEIVFTG